MRLTPKTIFFGLVALGLPFAVTIGWTLGTPVPPAPSLSAPVGLGGLGAAPVPKATERASESILDWSPRSPKPVAVESSLPTKAVVVSTVPTAAVPSAVVPSESPEPPQGPPVPTPTAVETPPPSPSATEPPDSAGPELFWPQHRNNGLEVLSSRP